MLRLFFMLLQIWRQVLPERQGIISWTLLLINRKAEMTDCIELSFYVLKYLFACSEHTGWTVQPQNCFSLSNSRMQVVTVVQWSCTALQYLDSRDDSTTVCFLCQTTATSTHDYSATNKSLKNITHHCGWVMVMSLCTVRGAPGFYIYSKKQF